MVGREFSDLAAAVHDNLMLWNEIGALVASDDNAFPPELRAGLFYLYEFTRKHSGLILQREADAKPLIDINTMIMKGLRPTSASKEAERCPV